MNNILKCQDAACKYDNIQLYQKHIELLKFFHIKQTETRSHKMTILDCEPFESRLKSQ